VPRPEYPRPDFERPNWLNLNGEWAFRYDPKDVGMQEVWFQDGADHYDQMIVVPFPWQSKLSGAGCNF
jgi:beta-galactosidase/beta-glucuronidase